MGRPERHALISAIEAARGSRVICYLTSTRDGMSADMTVDIPRLLVDHLSAPAPTGVRQIDLLLHSYGGEVAIPWRVVSILREHCERLAVIVPHTAYSAATLLALGADEIVMLPLAALGPIDPITANPFNPRDPANPDSVIAISVEDVAAYISLVKEDIGITHEDEVIQAFNVLAQHVHPLALGNVKRASQQSRMIARKLLTLHMDTDDERHRIEPIVEMLSSKFYYHGHPINRREAKDDLGLKVTIPPPEVERLVWNLFLEYEAEMQLNVPFSPEAELLAAGLVPAEGAWVRYDLPSACRLAFVESTTCADVLEQRLRVLGTLTSQGLLDVALHVLNESWVRE